MKADLVTELITDYVRVINDMTGNPIPNMYMIKDGVYGHYTSSNVTEMLGAFLSKQKKNKLLDLGSGLGILLNTLQKEYGTSVTGYEINELYAKIARRTCVYTEEKDILKLTHRDVKGHPFIYFYEPFTDPDMIDKFVTNLTSIITSEHTLIYNRAGNIYNYFARSGKYNITGLSRDGQEQIALDNVLLMRLK